MIFGNKLKKKVIEGMHQELVHKLATDGFVHIDEIGKFEWRGQTVMFSPSIKLVDAVRRERSGSSK